MQSSYSIDFNKAKMDSLFESLAKNEKSMGSFALSKDNNIIYQRTLGYKLIDSSKKIAADNKTKYRIGSISKMFTATMIFQLIEEGKLSLETNLSKFYPEIKNSEKITISNLLNHRSGLHNFTDDPEYLTYHTQDMTHKDLLAKFAKMEADYFPDETPEYCNTNYVLLGYIIEKISEKTYQEELNERICKKIGLMNTYYGGQINDKQNEAHSYQNLKGTWIQSSETSMSIPGGAGAIVSTSEDLIKFIEALFGEKLVSSKSLEKMKKIDRGYGMGMFKFPFYEKISFGHTGGIDNFTSIIGYFPKDKLAIAYISNGNDYSDNDIVLGTLSIFLGMEYSVPTFIKISVPEEILNQYTGNYKSQDIELEINVTNDAGELSAQATGQSAFPLEAKSETVFIFKAAGVKIVFDKSKSEMTLTQGGKSYLFKK